MAKVAELLISLRADSAALKKGLGEANGHLSRFGKQVDSLRSLIASGFVAAIGKQAVSGLAHFVKSGAEAADQMAKLAQSVGVPVEQLSRLNYAASFAGVSTQQLAQGMSLMNRALGDAALGKAEKVDVFRRLGINVRDAGGSLKNAEVVMREVAQRFSGLKDGAAKAAIAQQLFGESGTKLIPLLNQGAAGLAKMAAESDALGLTIDEKAGAAAERFNDSLARIQMVFRGLSIRVAGELAPNLASLAEHFVDAEKKGGGLESMAKDIAQAFRYLAHVAITSAAAVGMFADVVKRAMETKKKPAINFTGTAEERAAMPTGKDTLAGDLQKRLDTAAERLQLLWKQTEEKVDEGKRTAEENKKAGDSLVKSLGSKLKENQAWREAQVDRIWDKMERAADEWEATLERAGKEAADWREEEVDRLWDKMERASDDWADALEEAAKRAQDAFDSLVGMAKGRTGRVGSLIDTAAQGAAAGGPVGAVAAVGLDLLTSSKGFQDLVDVSDQLLQMLADTLGGVFDAVKPLVLALKPIVDVVGLVLKPAFDMLAIVLKPVAATLQMVGSLLKIIVMPLTVMQTVLMALQAPLQILQAVALPAFFYLAKGIGLVMMWVINEAGKVWNAMVGAVRALLAPLEAIDIAGWKPFAGLTAMFDALKAPDLSRDIEKLWNTNITDAVTDWSAPITDPLGETGKKGLGDGLGKLVDKVQKSTDAFAALNDSLTNIPRGFRVAAARYAAQGGVDGMAVPGGLAGFGKPIELNVYLDGRQLNATLASRQADERFLRSSLRSHPRNLGK